MMRALRWRAGVAAVFECDAVINRPGQHRSEQDHAAEVAVRAKMRKRPGFDSDQHRVLQPVFDVAGDISRDDQDAGRPHQQFDDMTRPARRIPYCDETRSAITGKAVTDQQRCRQSRPAKTGRDKAIRRFWRSSAARRSRMVTKTCAPRKTTRPRISTARPIIAQPGLPTHPFSDVGPRLVSASGPNGNLPDRTQLRRHIVAIAFEITAVSISASRSLNETISLRIEAELPSRAIAASTRCVALIAARWVSLGIMTR